MKYTLQSAFDKVYETVTVKGMNSRNRNSKGRSGYNHNPYGCFIGLLLPKELADNLENATQEVNIYIISTILEHQNFVVFAKVAEYFSEFSDDEINALTELQLIHDLELPTDWQLHLIKFAIKYGLTIRGVGNV